MGFPPDLPSVLRDLVAAAGGGRDLTVSLDLLLAHAIRAVPSCMGLSLTVTRQGVPVTVTALSGIAEGRPVLSSLAVHLPTSAAGKPVSVGCSVTLYAAEAHAFGYLAADLAALTDQDPRRAMLDGHLELPQAGWLGGSLAEQLEDMSTIDRAIGVLLGRGLLPADGRLELERLAGLAGSTVAAAAGLVLAAVARAAPET